MVILVSYLHDAYHFIAGCGISIYGFQNNLFVFLPGMFKYLNFKLILLFYNNIKSLPICGNLNLHFVALICYQ